MSRVDPLFTIHPYSFFRREALTQKGKLPERPPQSPFQVFFRPRQIGKYKEK